MRSAIIVFLKVLKGITQVARILAITVCHPSATEGPATRKRFRHIQLALPFL
jgi:hypothetical protein